METKDRGYFAPANAREWFEKRSYSHEEFKDVEKLARRKRELGLTVSLVLPSRNVADTIGGIVERINALNEEAPLGTPLVDQTLVVDADSGDGTAEVAAARDAEVYSENELLSHYGGAHGKGDAMWRSLSVARGDLVMFADADTKDFLPQFVYGTLGPIISVPSVRFVKELFSSIPFLTGYAVETGIMIDVYKKVGLEAMAQVDLGTRQNRHQPLFDLGKMSYAVLRAVARRLREDGRLRQVRDPSTPDSLFQCSDYLHAVATPEGLKLREHVEELVERPPMAKVLAGSRE